MEGGPMIRNLLVTLLAIFVWSGAASATTTEVKKRIFVVSSYHKDYLCPARHRRD